MATTLNFHQLPKESLPFNRLALIRAITELTDSTTSEAQEFRVTIPANSRLSDLIVTVPVAPQDVSDSGYDSVLLKVGDSSAADAFVASKEIAGLAGSPVAFAAMKKLDNLTIGNADSEISGLTIGGTYSQSEVQALRTKCEELADDVRAIYAALVSGLGKTYTSADYLSITVTPKSGKKLSLLDVGEIRVYCAMQRAGELG